MRVSVPSRLLATQTEPASSAIAAGPCPAGSSPTTVRMRGRPRRRAASRSPPPRSLRPPGRGRSGPDRARCSTSCEPVSGSISDEAAVRGVGDPKAAGREDDRGGVRATEAEVSVPRVGGGSMRVISPPTALATHSAPRPTQSALGCAPTAIRSVTSPLRSVDAKDLLAVRICSPERSEAVYERRRRVCQGSPPSPDSCCVRSTATSRLVVGDAETAFSPRSSTTMPAAASTAMATTLATVNILRRLRGGAEDAVA